jgi:hypothetical protein
MKIEGTTRIGGIIVNEKVWGFESHWDGENHRTTQCSGGPELCQGCLRKLPLKQFGVIEVYSLTNKGSEFVQLTPGAWDELERLASDGSLRGMRVILQRRSSKPKQPIVIDLIDWYDEVDKLPKPTDPISTLRRIWGLD